jgi:hypothetical protein
MSRTGWPTQTPYATVRAARRRLAALETHRSLVVVVKTLEIPAGFPYFQNESATVRAGAVGVVR